MIERPQYRFDGASAIVTGAASGIGRACAVALGTAGAAVLVADIDENGGRQTIDAIHATGGRAAFVFCDVRNDDQVAAAVDACLSMFGSLDVAINSAGIAERSAPMAEMDLEVFDRVVAINLRGMFSSLRHELRVMVERGCGAIVNLASGAGLVGVPGMAGYALSKHGIVGITKTAALDYAAAGIRINAICPGTIDTPILNGLNSEQRDPAVAAHPMGRIGNPEEIADAALWLCTPGASFVTGVALSVDGGYVVP